MNEEPFHNFKKERIKVQQTFSRDDRYRSGDDEDDCPTLHHSSP